MIQRNKHKYYFCDVNSAMESSGIFGRDKYRIYSDIARQHQSTAQRNKLKATWGVFSLYT